MIVSLFGRFAVAATVLSSALFAEDLTHFADIVVYGDSPSAVSAALELANASRDVLLVSPVKHIGGMMVEGLGHQDVDARSGSGDINRASVAVASYTRRAALTVVNGG